MDKAYILVVEDEKIVAMDIQRRLTSLGYTVVDIVATANECFNLVENNKPELILMDIVLKGDIDGISAAELIKNKYNIPVIYLTAYSDEMTIQRAKMTEPYGYIIKPYDLKDLQTTIEIALYRHKSEMQIAESEIKYKTLFDTAMDSVIVINKDGMITSANPKTFDLFGYSDNELKLNNIRKLIPEFYFNTKIIKEDEGKNKSDTIELTALNKEGAGFQIDMTFSMWKVKEEEFYTLIIRDITKRKEYEVSLIRNNDELENQINERTAELTSLIDQSPLAIRVFTNDGYLVYSNIICNELWDCKLNKSISIFDDFALNRYGYEKQINKIFVEGGSFKTNPIFFEPEEFEGMLNKNEVLLIFHFYAVMDANGAVSRVVNLVENITERFRIKEFGSELEELKNNYALSLQKLEDEKYRISRELHDCIGQILTAVKINLEVFEKSNKIDDKHITHAKKLLTEAGKEIKNIIHSLHPAILDNYGLITALKLLCDEFSETTGIEFSFSSNVEKIKLQTSPELTIYRIIQEAFNNIAKHSGAMKAEVIVFVNNNELYISIKDNGHGFELNKVNKNKSGIAYGITNMKERIEIIGGTFTIDSSKKNGTIINLIIPLDKYLVK